LVYSRGRRVAGAVLRLSLSEVVAVRPTSCKQLNRPAAGPTRRPRQQGGAHPQAQRSLNRGHAGLVTAHSHGLIAARQMLEIGAMRGAARARVRDLLSFGKNHQEVPLKDLAGTDPFPLTFTGDGPWTEHALGRPATLADDWIYTTTLQRVDEIGNPL
jgi:hypothetical protein